MDSTDDGRNPYGITCPTCASRPGEKCVSHTGRGPTVYHYPHITREQKAGYDFDRRQWEARRAMEIRRANFREDT